MRKIFLLLLAYICFCSCSDGNAKYQTDRVIAELEKYATDQSLNQLHAKILDQTEYNDSLCVTHLTLQTQSGFADENWINVEIIVCKFEDGSKKAYIGKPVIRQFGMETITNQTYGHLFTVDEAMKDAAKKAVIMLGKEI